MRKIFFALVIMLLVAASACVPVAAMAPRPSPPNTVKLILTAVRGPGDYFPVSYKQSFKPTVSFEVMANGKVLYPLPVGSKFTITVDGKPAVGTITQFKNEYGSCILWTIPNGAYSGGTHTITASFIPPTYSPQNHGPKQPEYLPSSWSGHFIVEGWF